MPAVYRIYANEVNAIPNYTSNPHDAALAAAKGKEVMKMRGRWEPVEVTVELDGESVKKENM